MSKRKRKNLLKIVKQRQQSDFTGREDEIALFKENLNLDYEDERRRFIFNIWGQGGVGKTTLLRRFRKMAQESDMVTAMVDEGESDIPAVMGQMSKQLAEQGHELKKFNERYKSYRQKREELESDSDAPTGGIGYAAGVVTRTALTVGKLHPIGSAFSTLMNEDKLVDQVSQWADHARRKLGNKDDVRLVLEPVDVLTPIFLADLDKIADDHGVVLLFDTYEQTSGFLDKWLRDILEGRHGDVLPLDFLVIAGRDELALNKWSAYEKLIARIPLEPFTEEEAITFLKSKGVENGEVIQFILEISGRFPLLVATLATEAPQSVDEVAEPSSTAVERFLWWIDEPLLRQIAVDAALPRRINRDIVAVIAGEEQADVLFEWLKERPFVIERTDGWSYHDVVRPLMLRHKRRESPQQWSTLHEKLADYFLQRKNSLAVDLVDALKNNDWLAFPLATTYHRLCQAPDNLNKELNFLASVLYKNRKLGAKLAESFIFAGRDANNQQVLHWGRKFRLVLQADEDGEYETVISLCTDILSSKVFQDSPQVSFLGMRGWCLKQINDYEGALADFNQALEIEPNDVDLLTSRGLIYRLQLEDDKALADFDRALELDPDNEMTLGSRAVLYRLRGRFTEALADFNRILEFDPEDSWVIAERAYIYRLQKDYELALREFDRAIHINPEDTWAIIQRGHTYRMQGKYEEALADFNRAIEFDPQHSGRIGQRGRIYRLQGAYDKALVDLNKVLELDPEDSWALAERGEIHRLQKNYGQALADFNRSIELDPDDEWAVASRGQVYEAQKEYQKALTDFGRAIEIDPEYAWPITERGDIYLLQKEYGKALADFNRALELDPENDVALVSRSITSLALQKYHDAVHDLKQVIELEPDDFSYYLYAIAVKLLGQEQEFEKYIELAIRTVKEKLVAKPESTDAALLLAFYLSSQGKMDEGLALLERTLANEPKRAALDEALLALGHLQEWIPSQREIIVPFLSKFEDYLFDK